MMECVRLRWSAYCSQCVTTSWNGDAVEAGMEWSAELFIPAPSQTGGRRWTTGSVRRLPKLESDALL